jgi:hypothetical protein
MMARYGFLACAGLWLLCGSCKKEALTDTAGTNAAPAMQSSAAGASGLLQTEGANNSWWVNWNNYADGMYPDTDALLDFGNASGWVNSRAWISNGSLRVRLSPKTLSAAGGIISNIEIADGSAYELDYDLRFHSLFDWSRGGKLGFGFLIGDGNTGGNPAWDGNGGSIRLIWYQTTAGRVYFQPYLYYKDQPGQDGNNFGLTYPATGSLSRGKWYHVHLYVKSNTGSNTNGRALLAINGTVLLDMPIRWTTNDSKRLIRSLSFHTFRGGSTPDYESATLGYIYYDNLKLHKISN